MVIPEVHKINKQLMIPVRGIDLVKLAKIDASEVKATTGVHLVIETRGKIVYLVMIEINILDAGKELLAMIDRKVPNEMKEGYHQYLKKEKTIMKKTKLQLMPMDKKNLVELAGIFYY